MKRSFSIKIIATVDIDALRKNLEYMRLRSGVRLLFMVKANAYGHGLEEVAIATQDIVDFFGVATVEEGVLLRKIGVKKPILVTIFSAKEADTAVQNNLSVAVFSEEQVLSLENAANKINSQNNNFNKVISDHLQYENIKSNNDIKSKIHIKIDTGMNRLGLKTKNEVDDLLHCICDCKNIDVEGCYSHLYNVNTTQYEKFDLMTNSVKKKYPETIFHISSSNAVCQNGFDKYDMVRVGIAGYGFGDANLRQVINISTNVIMSKKVCAGEHIGYGDFVAQKNCNIAIIFGGYGDGIPRNSRGYFLLRNQKCEILSVCMDMTIIDTNDFLAKEDECVSLVCDRLDANEFAELNDTISYEILTGFSRNRCETTYTNTKI